MKKVDYFVSKLLCSMSSVSLVLYHTHVSVSLLPHRSTRSSVPVIIHLIPTGSPSRGGDVAVYVFDKNQPSLLTPFFYSVLVSISVFMALSTVFHSINSPDNSPLSHSVLPVLFLPY